MTAPGTRATASPNGEGAVVEFLPDAIRPLPALTHDVEPFWTSGANGTLRILRCTTCGYYLHPPVPFCPRCEGRATRWTEVSGRGAVHTFTVSYVAWYPGFTPPYTVAVVELAEQRGLRLTTNIVDCPPEDVHIGMDVAVCFSRVDDVWLPLFRPVAGVG